MPLVLISISQIAAAAASSGESSSSHSSSHHPSCRKIEPSIQAAEAHEKAE
jgi:hypothetical protein